MPRSSMKKEIGQDGDRELISIPIDKNFICLRGISPNRLRFEIEYGLERGSTANSFLLTSNEDNENLSILIHPPGIAYGNIFLKALEDHCSPKFNHLQVVVGHINPNRVALLKKLVDIYPKITLICSAPGGKLLKEIWIQQKPSKTTEVEISKTTPKFPKIHLIKTTEIIDIKSDFRLALIPAPTARWPGQLMVFEESLGLLMSDKLFGAHICTKEWAENTPSSTEEERRHYFDSLMASMSSQINLIVEQLEELEIRTIAPGHGPAIEGSWRSLLNDYRRWGEIKESSYLKIVLLFASAYGNTAAIADALAQGISRTGIQVKSINCEFASNSELVSAIREADAYLIGSPTLGGHAPTPIVSALGTLLAEGDRKKKVGVFGSYGWSGEALDLLENKLLDGGFSFGFDPIKVKFSPNVLMVKTIMETGTYFGRTLLREKSREIKRTGGGLNVSKSDPTILALGRIVGSLCILTACKGNEDNELTGAMVASWVSQASFSPLGLSIAVAKDRAVENLLHKEDVFALNILSVKKHQNILKQFLQSFAPGENRFSGLELQKSPNGQPILPEALAWLEGRVKQRMECGDHWLVYAEINYGNVLDPDGVTAVHHRRTGANY